MHRTRRTAAAAAAAVAAASLMPTLPVSCASTPRDLDRDQPVPCTPLCSARGSGPFGGGMSAWPACGPPTAGPSTRCFNCGAHMDRRRPDDDGIDGDLDAASCGGGGHRKDSSGSLVTTTSAARAMDWVVAEEEDVGVSRRGAHAAVTTINTTTVTMASSRRAMSLLGGRVCADCKEVWHVIAP